MNGAEDMILPDDFEAPADPGAADAADAGNELKANEPAQPQAGLDIPGGEAGDATPGAEPPAEEGSPEEGQLKIKVKFNHEEREIGLDEAVPLIQKGLNYDKLRERLDALQNDPRLDEYERMAEVGRLLGYQTSGELLDALYQRYYELKAGEQGITVEQARMDEELRRREAALSQKERQEAAERAEREMYERFLLAYPDVKPGDISPETWALVRQGVDLTAAYAIQRNRELEAQLMVMRQNMSNRKAAPGLGTQQHGSEEAAPQDPFLLGFDSVI